MLTALLSLALAEPLDLSGTWRLEYVVVNKAEVPVVGSLKSRTTSVVLARVEARDGALVVTHDLCGTQVDGGIVKSKLPDAYVASVPRKRYRLELRGEGDGVYADTGQLQVGFDPAACVAVPTEADDPCVVDWDGDGHPGATIAAKAPMFPWVDVYVAQRNHLVLEGAVHGDRIEGRARMPVLENYVIGASNRLFARSPKTSLVEEESVFTMTRLAADASCVEALMEPAR